MDSLKFQELSFVSFRQHVNLGGISSKTLHPNGMLLGLRLLENGMVQVKRQEAEGIRLFYVAAQAIEAVEAKIELAGEEKADLLKEKANLGLTASSKDDKSGKRANLAAPKGRADEILAELAANRSSATPK